MLAIGCALAGTASGSTDRQHTFRERVEALGHALVERCAQQGAIDEDSTAAGMGVLTTCAEALAHQPLPASAYEIVARNVASGEGQRVGLGVSRPLSVGGQDYRLDIVWQVFEAAADSGMADCTTALAQARRAPSGTTEWSRIVPEHRMPGCFPAEDSAADTRLANAFRHALDKALERLPDVIVEPSGTDADSKPANGS